MAPRRARAEYNGALDKAHVLPLFPNTWHWPASAQSASTAARAAQPARARNTSRFINPGDYRVVREACGACHLLVIEAAERSIMATGAMLLGGASYNNGILPYKQLHPRRGLHARGRRCDAARPGQARRQHEGARVCSSSSIRCRPGRRRRRAMCSACLNAAGAISSTCSRNRAAEHRRHDPASRGAGPS